MTTEQTPQTLVRLLPASLLAGLLGGGLLAVQGSQAAWHGAAVRNNGTPVNITIAAHGADGSEQFVLNRRV